MDSSDNVLSSTLEDLSADSPSISEPDSTTIVLPDNTGLPPEATFILLIRSVDKPSSSLPQNITMMEDFIHAGLGFRRIDTLSLV